MTKLASVGRKALAALLAAAAIGAAAAPSAASAHGFGHHGHGVGFGAAGLVGGLLVGSAIAASGDRVVYERRCWTERQRFYDEDGFPYVRRVRVCD